MEEQWKRVNELDPELVMITGWNEWWAGRWGVSKGGAEYGQHIGNTYKATDQKPLNNTYIDCISPEFSRDLEPMKGGFGDSFYYQMASYIREYKGTREQPLASNQKAIEIDGDFAQWDEVGAEFRDTMYDTAHRDYPSYGGTLHYTNTSGRNDIIAAKVSVKGDYANFYVRTREELTKPASNDTKWMNLYIDIDQNSKTGWQGYDYIINRSRNGSKVSIEKYAGSGYKWTKAGECSFRMEGNQMHLAVPLSVLGVKELKHFDFKWADNSVGEDDVMKFMDMGDAAPNDRYNFRYAVDRETKHTSKDNVRRYLAADAQVKAANENWDSAVPEIKDWNENTRVDFIVQSGKDMTEMLYAALAAGTEGGKTALYVNDEFVREFEVSASQELEFKDYSAQVELQEGENVISFRGGTGVQLNQIKLKR